MGRKRSAGNERLGQYVQLRTGGHLELRFPIPEDVRHAFLGKTGQPRKQLIESLGTSDIRLANAKADGLRTSIRADIERVRAASSKPSLGDFLRSLFDAEAKRDQTELRQQEVSRRRELFTQPGGPVSKSTRLAETRRVFSGSWGNALLSEDHLERRAVAGWAADDYFQRVLGRRPELGSAEYQEVLERCAEVLVDSIVVQDDVRNGRPASPLISQALTPEARAIADLDSAATPRGKLKLSNYFETVYVPTLQQGKAITGERTLPGKRLAVKLFTELLGDKAIHSISTGDMWEYHDALLELPDRRGLKDTERELGSRTLIERVASGVIVAPLLHPKTVNKHISGIKSVLDLAAKRRDVTTSAAQGVRAEVNQEEETGRAFTTDELNRIFRLPLFAGCSEGLVEGGLFKSGPVLIQDDRFWIPLLLLFTGARSSEIVGLEAQDVEPDHAFPHILIKPNTTRGLKNRYSKRMVPIHPFLIEVGFLEFARKQRTTQTTRFFPLAVQLRYKNAQADELQNKALSNCLIMRQFNRTWLQHADAGENGGTVKCFRNTFEQEALPKIPSEEIRRRLTGRRVDSSVTIYTQNIPDDQIKRTDLLEMLSASMNLVTFRGVDLSHIHRAATAQAATE